MRRHERFIRREKILLEVAALYKIRRPVIFSPYARRAVEIKIDGLTTADLKGATVDWQLDANNLRGKLLTDRELCWNVTVEEADTQRGGDIEEYIGEDDILIRYGYTHTFDRDAKIFVLPNQHTDDLNVTLDEEQYDVLRGVRRRRTLQIQNRLRKLRDLLPDAELSRIYVGRCRGMRYIWQNYDEETDFWIERKLSSPYLEVDCGNEHSIGMNPVPRFGEIFSPLFESDALQNSGPLENCLLHYLALTDLHAGIHRVSILEHLLDMTSTIGRNS